MPIGDYFTMTSDSGEISYRPTCHHAYYPADDAMRAAENADAGIVEAGEIDFVRCLQVQRPSLSPVEGHFTTWTPLMGRSLLFPQDIGPTSRGSSEMSSSRSRAGRR